MLPEDNKHTFIVIVSSRPTQANIYYEFRLQEIAIWYAVTEQIASEGLNMCIGEWVQTVIGNCISGLH